MEWVKTTLRKGTKTPKICRDMFITDSRGSFVFGVVKNGQMVTKEPLSREKAKEMIIQNRLVRMESPIFANCGTYRDAESATLVNQVMAESGI